MSAILVTRTNSNVTLIFQLLLLSKWFLNHSPSWLFYLEVLQGVNNDLKIQISEKTTTLLIYSIHSREQDMSVPLIWLIMYCSIYKFFGYRRGRGYFWCLCNFACKLHD